MDWQREVIRECIRVAGPEGIVLYHHMAEASGEGGLDTKFELVTGFAGLRKIIIWQHRPPVVDLLDDQHNSDSWITGSLDHPGFKPWTSEMPGYSFIYAFAGVNWSLPEETSLAASLWGDVWLIEPIYERGYRDRPRWVSFPPRLADRCIALGKGTVLDPFAASGAIPLAAIKAGRNWLACDTRPALMAEFEKNRATAWQEISDAMRLVKDLSTSDVETLQFVLDSLRSNKVRAFPSSPEHQVTTDTEQENIFDNLQQSGR